MPRLYVVLACATLLILGAFADVEYEDHGHHDHHHHHHDGREWISREIVHSYANAFV